MPFKNEFANEKDMEKFDLVGLWNKYAESYEKPFFGLRPTITIDRERNIFLREVWHGSREWNSGEVKYLLWVNGSCVRARMSQSLTQNIQTMVQGVDYCTWRLDELRIPENSKLEAEEVIAILKEALIADGNNRAMNPAQKAEIKFKF